MKDNFGNRMKSYETKEKLLSRVPIVARIDGKSFSKWTKKFKKPYDKILHDAFVETTKQLIKETHAIIGYTQSDEITLIFDEEWDYFGRNLQKLTSVLSSITSASFNKQNLSKKLAFFDCRVFAVSNRSEASNCVLWREMDATKNAILSLGYAHFSHKELHGLDTKQIQEKLWDDKFINFNDKPTFFKRGTFVQKIKYYNEEKQAIRSMIIEREMPPFVKVINRNDVIFEQIPYQIEETQ